MGGGARGLPGGQDTEADPGAARVGFHFFYFICNNSLFSRNMNDFVTRLEIVLLAEIRNFC